MPENRDEFDDYIRASDPEATGYRVEPLGPTGLAFIPVKPRLCEACVDAMTDRASGLCVRCEEEADALENDARNAPRPSWREAMRFRGLARAAMLVHGKNEYRVALIVARQQRTIDLFVAALCAAIAMIGGLALLASAYAGRANRAYEEAAFWQKATTAMQKDLGASRFQTYKLQEQLNALERKPPTSTALLPPLKGMEVK